MTISDLKLQPDLMPAILAERAARHGDRVAMQFDQSSLTYRELHDRANWLAGALQARGINKGDRVALLLSNRAEIVISIFALAAMGAVAVPVSTALKGPGLAHILRQSSAVLAIVEGEFYPRLQEALGEWGQLARLVIVGEISQEPAIFNEPFDTLLAEKGEPVRPYLDPSDPWAIMFTSGTTGPSKGAVLPQQMFSTLCLVITQNLYIKEDSVSYSFLPLYHLNALIFCMGAAIFTGSRAVSRNRFPQERLLEDLRETGATHTTLLPFIILGLLARPAGPADRDHSLQYIVSIALTKQQWYDFEDRFGVTILTGYGPTETGSISNLPFGRRDKAGCAGKPNDRFEVAILDDFDRTLPPGQVGEIVCRPRYPYEVMLGYDKNPETTLRAWRNLWFHTGDVGWLDEDGFLWFADRLKDMIKRRGVSISSYDIEQVLLRYPGVMEAAVVPYKVPGSGEEEVRAFIVPKSGTELDPAALISDISNQLAYYMVPRFLDFTSDLPRNPIGKIEKFKLRLEGLRPETFDVKAAGIILER